MVVSIYLSLVSFQDTTDDTGGSTHGPVKHVHKLSTFSHLLCLAVPHLQPARGRGRLFTKGWVTQEGGGRGGNIPEIRILYSPGGKYKDTATVGQ